MYFVFHSLVCSFSLFSSFYFYQFNTPFRSFNLCDAREMYVLSMHFILDKEFASFLLPFSRSVRPIPYSFEFNINLLCNIIRGFRNLFILNFQCNHIILANITVNFCIAREHLDAMENSMYSSSTYSFIIMPSHMGEQEWPCVQTRKKFCTERKEPVRYRLLRNDVDCRFVGVEDDRIGGKWLPQVARLMLSLFICRLTSK